ncbi:polysaccharide biosynthesis C-terminal domain-containing protein [Mycolicibacterium vanbaalenii]|uniref:polysaccharide biosynthesis C-terminal domain-containing protein n=1 Tax=Mycolicibacterium vanbaalenii TaxID=110539 RepID=UPI001F221BA8|nr:polysaccharide biosynthesis C-terminal domain-containing protein [Mycolicibacterium vanbaalenii]UJL31491.1 polysaccharide biosynthesis C-terminal domain-containing protein [Mycolicibacterium vanbaalenii]WND58341.1 polysaccharide biosynthesis C-terminal domain-containing protein [Mycolicibacterium vanbaalenii]
MKRWIELALFAVSPLSALLAAPLLARGLGPDGRGDFALALAVFSLGATLGNFGQTERVGSLLRDRGSISFWPSRILVFSASTAASCVAFISMLMLGLDPKTALVVSLAIPISSLGLLLRAIAVAAGRVLLLAIQAAVPSVFRVAMLGLLFVSVGLTTYLATLVTVCTSIAGILLVRIALSASGDIQAKSLNHRGAPASEVRRDIYTCAVQGLPIVGFTLCVAVMLRADIFMLTALSTGDQVGFYAATVAITEAALAISAAFKNRMQAAVYTDDALPRVRHEGIVMVSLLGPAIVGGQLVAEPFIIHFFGSPFAPAIPAFRVLLFAAAAQMLLDCAQGLLAVLGRQRAMLATSAFGAVITIGSLAVLIPAFGAVGAAMSSLFAYSAVAATSWFLVVMSLRSGR